MRFKAKPIENCPHLDRSHYSNGLCRSCYEKAYTKRNPERAARKAAYHQAYNDAHKAERVAKQRARSLKRLYNLTPEQWEAMFRSQNGLCAICKRPAKTVTRPLNVDHNHVTGQRRGLLCLQCNIKLGWYEDYTKQILEYLTFWDRERRALKDIIDSED
jgi:hypothetical protein